MQSLDFNENTIELEDFGAKWKAFGWNVIEVNGNSHSELKSAFAKAEELRSAEPHKPTVIIADTVKGCGVTYMQNDILWHYRFPHDGWEYDEAVTEMHKKIPAGVVDPYTPDGIADPTRHTDADDIGNDHTFTKTWNTTYPETMRRVEAAPGSDEEVREIGGAAK